MNILCIDQFSDFGGGQLCLRDLIPCMRGAGFRPHAMIPAGGPFVDWMRRASVPVEELPISGYACARKSAADVLRFPLDALRAAAAIRRAVERYGIDLAYVNGPRALPAAVLAGVPIAFHAHSAFRKAYVRRLLGWCFRRFDGPVIAASHFIAGTITDLLPPGRLKVIHNGVFGPPAMGRRFRTPGLCVGIAGRISPEKGHLDFVRAAEMVATANPQIRFVVVGEAMFSRTGFDRTVRKKAENSRVRFLGWSDDIQSSLAKIDILAVPSTEEPFGRVIIEAFAAGTPVVAYPSGGIPELIEHGRTGWLTGSLNAESLASAILFLDGRRDEMERLSAAGRREWERRFTLERFGREVCAVLSAAQLEGGAKQSRQDAGVMPGSRDYESQAGNRPWEP